jgi:hypothetical protein
MPCRHHRRSTRSRGPVLVLLALAVSGAASSSSTRALQDEPPAGDPALVRARWASMSEDERRELRANWEQWKSLPSSDREELRARHSSFQRWQRKSDRLLEPDERRALERLRGPERRREMQRLTRGRLQDYLHTLPPELRPELMREMRGLSPEHRERRFRERVREEAVSKFDQLVDGLKRRGRLSEPGAQGVRRRFREGGPNDRYQLTRRLLHDHPDEIHFSREELAALVDTEDPFEAMRAVQRVRAPELTREAVAELLRQGGVPIGEVERYLRAREPGSHGILVRLCERHRVVPPHAQLRWLRSHGVSAEQLRRALGASSPRAVLDRLQKLREELEVEPLEYENYLERASGGRRRPTDPGEGRRSEAR